MDSLKFVVFTAVQLSWIAVALWAVFSSFKPEKKEDEKEELTVLFQFNYGPPVPGADIFGFMDAPILKESDVKSSSETPEGCRRIREFVFLNTEESDHADNSLESELNQLGIKTEKDE